VKKKLILINLSHSATTWQVENIGSGLLYELGNKANEYEKSVWHWLKLITQAPLLGY
jgi:hypothetical protein